MNRIFIQRFFEFLKECFRFSKEVRNDIVTSFFLIFEYFRIRIQTPTKMFKTI